MLKALFFDFYGTLVEEDDRYIQDICERISKKSEENFDPQEIGSYWGQQFSSLCLESYGARFKTQRTLETISLQNTISHFKSNEDASKLSEILFEYWQRPVPFNDSLNFFKDVKLPVYLISNIDRNDLESAVEYCGFPISGCFTSEDVRSYKPRPEIFEAALAKLGIDQEAVYHIGDSLSCDVTGANNAGISSIWLNRKKRKAPQDKQLFGNCNSLPEVLDLLTYFD